MDFTELFIAYGFVFLLSAIPFFEAWGVIPVSILAGLSIVPALIIGLLGNILTILLLVMFIDKIKQWRNNRKKKKGQDTSSKRTARAQNLWNKYGLPGLAFIGPLFVGSHLTTFFCLTSGGSKNRTTYWMIASISTWSILFAVLAFFGIDLLGFEDRNMIKDFFE
ncbi:small multi-drug export protein [Aquibacillus rhizosphaerae]|uniref:Small multi-drug export protein n=1 Tax=Aquibacillus rhizosphaerae TaxID=3051431 RepID=A0ABT7L891_9BACI|nr:small multi-drug export protein [Aquibacillus sp. LR5S19]MDL4842082.1 small multi-drug export protein [Aquibacillus sp. LR5S19]